MEASVKLRGGLFRPPRETLAHSRERMNHYRNIINALLLASTFAGTVTLSIILTPDNNNDTTIPGIVELAYAGSLFLAGIMGCILITVSVELEKPNWILIVETITLSAMLCVAFYLLLFASTFYIGDLGPFILGSVLYLGFGILMFVFIASQWFGRKED